VPRIACLFILLLGLFLVPSASAKTAGEKVDALDRALRLTGESGRGDRYVNGAGLLMVGSASLAAALLASRSSIPSLRSEGPVIFGVLGGMGLLGGSFTLASRREYETLPEQYRSLPERSPSEVAVRAEAGEAYLLLLSERSRRERHWIAAIAGGLGTSLMAGYVVNPPYLGGALLYVGGFCLFTSIVNLASEGKAETEWRKYQTGEVEEEEEVSWSVSPLPEAVRLSFSWWF
jgi:hypothetical protein